MKFWYNPNFLAIFFLLFFSIFALKDLAKPGFYTSHDGETHTARIAQYYQALKDGQFPPRWAKTLHGGLGSPVFVYIYPLPYFTGSLIHTIGYSFTDTFEILMALSFIFSGIFSYMWLKEVWDYPRAAFLGALFYIWVPYKFSLIYVRGSISESLAYTFLPLVFWSLTKLSQKISLNWIAFSALSISLLLLSQNLIALITIITVAFYVLILAFTKKSFKYFFASLLSGIWGLAIASFTYLPALLERNLVHFDELFQLVYNSHFVTINQLIHSPWGYGFSLPGTVNDGLSFQIGLTHLLIVVFSIGIFMVFIFQKLSFFKNVKNAFFENSNLLQLSLTSFFMAVFIFSIFVMVDIKPTYTFWKVFKPITYVDIPWRFLGVSALATSFIAAFVAKSIRNGAIFVLLVVAVLIANRNHLKINQSVFFDDEFFLNYQGSATQYNEFTPRTRYSTGVTDDFDLPIESIKGKIKIYDLVQKSNVLVFKTQSDKPSRIQVNLLKFEGWRLSMDSEKFVNNPELVDKSYSFVYRPDIDTSGLYDLIVPFGNHEFKFMYKEPIIRKIANLISFTFIVIVVGILANSSIRKVKKNGT